MNTFPKNCTECEHTKTCNHACYGSRACMKEKEIAKAILEQHEREEREVEKSGKSNLRKSIFYHNF